MRGIRPTDPYNDSRERKAVATQGRNRRDVTNRFEVATRETDDLGDWRLTRRHVFIGTGLATIAGALAVAFGGAPDAWGGLADAEPPVRLGDPVPDRAITLLDGSTVRLRDGEPRLLNFWATWCPPCRAEIPEIDHYARARGPDGLRVLAVNLAEDVVTIERYLRPLGVSFSVGLDPERSLAANFGVAGLPTSYAIDRAGVIRRAHAGPMSRATIESLIAVIL